MDIYNTKEIGKKSTINDKYWKESLQIAVYLQNAIEGDNGITVEALLKNHKLFRGRA